MRFSRASWQVAAHRARRYGPAMPPTRRTQKERSAATRATLLAAAYESLLESGTGATTVGHVQQRDGGARGTLRHPFPTSCAPMAHAVEDIIVRSLHGYPAVRYEEG